MARLAFWAALTVAAAVIVGCGPVKELPDEGMKGTDPGEKPVAIPAASEPAAKAYVEKAVKAYTGGKPELVAKGKVCRVVLKGQQYKLDNVPVVQTVRTVAAVWPDRYVDTDERHAEGRQVVLTAYLHRPRFVVMAGGTEQDVGNVAERERNFTADQTGQLWMALLLPLTDPKAIVYDLRQSTFLPLEATQPVPVQTLKLALGDFPPYQLTFDTKTDALLRVEYAYSQLGSQTRQVWTMADHQSSPEGLLLPKKAEFRLNSAVVEEWMVDKWEFPAAINDAEFAPPKK